MYVLVSGWYEDIRITSGVLGGETATSEPNHRYPGVRFLKWIVISANSSVGRLQDEALGYCSVCVCVCVCVCVWLTGRIRLLFFSKRCLLFSHCLFAGWPWEADEWHSLTLFVLSVSGCFLAEPVGHMPPLCSQVPCRISYWSAGFLEMTRVEEMAGAEERSQHCSLIRVTRVCLCKCVCTVANILLHLVSALDSSGSFLLFFLFTGRRRLFLHKDTLLSGVGRRFISIDVDRKCACTPSLNSTFYNNIWFPFGGNHPIPWSWNWSSNTLAT